MILVVVVHVALSYQSTPEPESMTSIAEIGDRYRNPDRTEVAERLHQVARASVNPMFFLLAGYSWAFLLQRHRLRSIAWNRTTRILIPMAVGWFIGFPLVRCAFALGRALMLSAEGESSLATAFTETSFTPYLPFASGRFYLAHFWFLYYLLLFYLASAVLVLCLDRPAGPLRKRLRSLQAAILVGDLRWLRLPLLLILFVLATLPDTNPELAIAQGPWPDPKTFSAHYVFFLVGWMFALHPEILGDLHRWAGIRFLSGLLLAVFIVVPLGNNHVATIAPAELWLGSGPIQLSIYWLLHAIATWLMVLGMLGLADRWFTRVDPRLAYLAQAGFWLYLVHLPFAVLVPVLLHHWSLDADIKMWVASAIVLAICFASYHFLVRGTVIGRWIQGRYRRTERRGSSVVTGSAKE